MKKTFFLLLIIFVSCTANRHIHQSRLDVTRRYAGTFIESVPGRKYTEIHTSQSIFSIRGKPELAIPLGAKCYVKYISEILPGDPHIKVWILYFTWDGCVDLFMIRQNYITGEIIGLKNKTGIK
ncbi:hypothetical protein ES708_28079 [subsurface metagenome]